MHKCVHCSKERRDCRCPNVIGKPITPHDFPGQKRVLRLMFELPDFGSAENPFPEFVHSARIVQSMAFMIDKALFEGDGPVRNYDATKAKHDAFFSSSQFSRPYYRTKHGGSDG